MKTETYSHKVANLLRMNEGRIFRVTFIKRTDGQLRHMVCRMGVRPKEPSKGRAYDPAAHDLVTVFDVQKRGYRTVDLWTVQEVAMMGTTINLR